MKVILHTEFDIFTYKAVGAAVGILIYAILAYEFPQIDLMVACLIAFFIGSLVWYLLYFILIKKDGICIEFRYSKNRPRLVSVTLSKRFKQIEYMEFELPTFSGEYKQGFDDQVLFKFKCLFSRHLSTVNEYGIIQFVGCTQKDANKISEIFNK